MHTMHAQALRGALGVWGAQNINYATAEHQMSSIDAVWTLGTLHAPDDANFILLDRCLVLGSVAATWDGWREGGKVGRESCRGRRDGERRRAQRAGGVSLQAAPCGWAKLSECCYEDGQYNGCRVNAMLTVQRQVWSQHRLVPSAHL